MDICYQVCLYTQCFIFTFFFISCPQITVRPDNLKLGKVLRNADSVGWDFYLARYGPMTSTVCAGTSIVYALQKSLFSCSCSQYLGLKLLYIQTGTDIITLAKFFLIFTPLPQTPNFKLPVLDCTQQYFIGL